MGPHRFVRKEGVMPIEVHTNEETHVIDMKITGTLTKDDYAQFVPVAEDAIRRFGKANIYFEMHDFTGWTLGASWEDLKFDIKHFTSFSRIAIVGDRAWEHAMAVLSKPFTKARVRYFDRSESAQARAWLIENQ